MNDHRPTVMTWKPTPDAVSVAGGPLPADADFFVSPPAEVGRVVSAWSDVRRDQTLWSFPLRLAAAGACVVLAGLAIAWMKAHAVPGEKPDLVHLAAVMVPLCVAVLALATAFKKKWVGYVGDRGAAVYSTRGTRDAVGGQAVRFADVADVQIARTGQQKNWIDWTATFVGPDGATRMKLRGNARMANGRPAFNPIYAIAAAAHKAWEQSRVGQS